MVVPPSRCRSLIIEVLGSAAICAVTLAAEILLNRARRLPHP